MIVVKMYVTLLSAIIAGLVNSIFCKLNILKVLKKPIDNKKKLSDGKRIFGDNKTWKGLIGYIIFNIIFAILFGLLWKVTKLEHLNYFYINHNNRVLYNILIGALLGLFYALFELPNSFLKRRLGIEEGKTTKGFLKIFFIFLDQADSVFGMALVVWMFYPIGIWIYLLFVIIGAVTHIVLNILLYLLHIRKNMF